MRTESSIDPGSRALFSSDLAPGANTAAVTTIAVDAEQFWVLDYVRWSYDGVPTGGKVTVAIDGTTVDEFDITASGPGILHYYPGLYAEDQDKNETLVVTLAAGGVGVTGKLMIRYR